MPINPPSTFLICSSDFTVGLILVSIDNAMTASWREFKLVTTIIPPFTKRLPMAQNNAR